MTRILVTGASGLLGLNFAHQFCKQHEIIGIANRQRLSNPPFKMVLGDLSVPGSAKELVARSDPEMLIHCAAMADIDTCEKDPDLAMRVNRDLAGELADHCSRAGIAMVHVSTDAVFDGLTGGYRETDIPNPLHVYGKTKLEGEKAVAQAYPEAAIVRVNFYGWSLGGKRSLSEFFFYNLSEGQTVKGFTDVLFCPLQVNDLAEILLEVAQQRLSGLYHAASPECLSKFEFGLSIARRFGFRGDLVIPVSWKEGGLVAARSPNLTLNVDKLHATLGRVLPGQMEGLERFYQEYQDGLPALMRNERQRM